MAVLSAGRSGSLGRRDFIRTSGVALTAASLAQSSIRESPRAGEDHGGGLGPIGVQLYTVRELMRRDFDATLATVAAIGYREVEFAGYFGRSPTQVRASLARHGLAAPSTHLDFDLLETAWPKTLADAKTIGHQYVVIPSVPERVRATLDDWRRVAERFNRAGEAARAAGLTFGYHNHQLEFAPVEGKVPYDILLERTDPALVTLEMDLFWITVGGGKPLEYFTHHPGRFPLVHVKDLHRGGGASATGMADVGDGTIDWPSIFAHRRQAGIRHLFVEHDDPPDPIGSIRKSYRYLSTLNA